MARLPVPRCLCGVGLVDGFQGTGCVNGAFRRYRRIEEVRDAHCDLNELWPGIAFHIVATGLGLALAARRAGETRLPQPQARAEQADSLP
jgi:hypothetical protein